MGQPDTIKVCPGHRTAQTTALTFTFAWPYKELWCGYCGRTFAMFDDYERVPETPRLEAMSHWYKKHFKRFLRAVGIMRGGGRLRFRGSMYGREDLSQASKDRLEATIAAWPEKTKCPKNVKAPAREKAHA